MKAVSVIVPIYNTAGYLSECIDSIINQTLPDIEIILINDGSTDGSGKLAEEYAKKHNNIILIHQDNAGLSAARNRGLRAAAGKYVYFIDSDDLLEETALENLYQTSERERLDILYFAARTFYESDALKNECKNFNNHYLRKGLYPDVLEGKDLLSALYRNGDYKVSACLQFIRREYLLENGIWFYEGIIHEDNLFTFEALIKAERTRCLSDIYYYRRVRSNSIMTQKATAANLRGYFVSFMEQIKIAAKIDCTEEQHEVVLDIIKGLVNRVKQMYSDMDPLERNKFLRACTMGERYLFEGIFITHIHEVDRLKRAARNTENKGGGQRKRDALVPQSRNCAAGVKSRRHERVLARDCR